MTGKIVLSSELSLKLDKVLQRLRQKVHPEGIILTDISGQLIAAYTKVKETNIENLAALFASSMGATIEIANEVMESEGFEFNLHEGKQTSVFISKISNSFILAVIFQGSETTGMIRLFTKRACKEIQNLVEEFEQEVNNNLKPTLTNNFSEELSKQLMDLFDIKQN